MASVNEWQLSVKYYFRRTVSEGTKQLSLFNLYFILIQEAKTKITYLKK